MKTRLANLLTLRGAEEVVGPLTICHVGRKFYRKNLYPIVLIAGYDKQYKAEGWIASRQEFIFLDSKEK